MVMMNGVAAYALGPGSGCDDLVLRHSGLVKRIAYHLSARLPDTVLLDDLMQAGMVGLLEAVRNYDAHKEASFETFAGIRIRGAMLDEVRRQDWTPRSVHRRSRMVSEAVHAIEAREGRHAHDTEIAEELGISLHEYHQILHETRGCRLMSLSEAADSEESMQERLPSGRPGVVEGLQDAELRERLAEVIAELPERERLVMALYYDEELNLREIGAVLGVSESRACQIHGQAVHRIRARVGDWAM
jgi:RNA polymerase sigma factor for flagellar operon FliA